MKVDRNSNSTSRTSSSSRSNSRNTAQSNSTTSTGQRTGPKAGDLTPVRASGGNDGVSFSNEARNQESGDTGATLSQNLLSGWGMDEEADSRSPREIAGAAFDDLGKLGENEQPNEALQGALEHIFDLREQDYVKEHGELPNGELLLIDLSAAG